MNNNIFTVDKNSVVKAHKPFVVHCGCGSATAALNNCLKKMGYVNNPFPVVKLSGNKAIKKYLKDNGYYDVGSSLNKSIYAVLIDPIEGKLVDFFKKDKIQLAEEVKHVITRK